MALPFLRPQWRLTTAQRTSIVIPKGVLVYDTDLDRVYVGDDSTSGGLLLNTSAYVLKAGDTMTGALTVPGLTSTGNVGVAGLLALSASGTAFISMQDTVHTDADGARATFVMFSGEKSGGEGVAQAMIHVAHEGSADDSQGRYRVYVSDTDDTTTPTVLMFEAAYDDTKNTGSKKRIKLAGDDATGLGHRFHGHLDSALDLGAVRAWLDIEWVEDIEDSGFSHDDATNPEEITCNFDGRVEVTVHGAGELTSGTRNGLRVRLQVDTGSGFGDPATHGIYASSYLRQTTPYGSATIAQFPIAVSDGDIIKAQAQATINATGATCEADYTYIDIKRVIDPA